MSLRDVGSDENTGSSTCAFDGALSSLFPQPASLGNVRGTAGVMRVVTNLSTASWDRVRSAAHLCGLHLFAVRSQLPFEPVAPSRKRSVRRGRSRPPEGNGRYALESPALDLVAVRCLGRQC